MFIRQLPRFIDIQDVVSYQLWAYVLFFLPFIVSFFFKSIFTNKDAVSGAFLYFLHGYFSFSKRLNGRDVKNFLDQLYGSSFSVHTLDMPLLPEDR